MFYYFLKNKHVFLSRREVFYYYYYYYYYFYRFPFVYLWFEVVNCGLAMQCACIKLVSVFCGNVPSNIKYSVFYTSRIIAAVSLHPPIFNLAFALIIDPILDLLDTRLPPHSQPFWTRLVWSWSKLPREVVSIMIRINMFRSWFAQCTPHVNTFHKETCFIREQNYNFFALVWTQH